MVKKLPALKARQNLGQVMNEVALRGDEYIVERAGKPLVAIISMEKYRMFEKDRMFALEAVNDIWDKMKEENSQTIEDTIDKAVKAVRNRQA
jgi:prevent-host-death family protein